MVSGQRLLRHRSHDGDDDKSEARLTATNAKICVVGPGWPPGHEEAAATTCRGWPSTGLQVMGDIEERVGQRQNKCLKTIACVSGRAIGGAGTLLRLIMAHSVHSASEHYEHEVSPREVGAIAVKKFGSTDCRCQRSQIAPRTIPGSGAVPLATLVFQGYASLDGHATPHPLPFERVCRNSCGYIIHDMSNSDDTSCRLPTRRRARPWA